MVPDIRAKFHNQQFIMRRAINLFLTLFVQNDLKWRTFSITLEKLEPQWPHSEQRSDVIHGSGCTMLYSQHDHARVGSPRMWFHTSPGILTVWKTTIMKLEGKCRVLLTNPMITSCDPNDNGLSQSTYQYSHIRPQQFSIMSLALQTSY